MSQVCRFYARGTCRFGERCRFLHPGYKSDHNYQDDYQEDDLYSSGGRYSDNYHNEDEYQQYDHYSTGNRYGQNYRDGYQRNDHYSSGYRYDENYHDGNQRNDYYSSSGPFDNNQRSFSSNTGYSFNRNENFNPNQHFNTPARNSEYSDANYGQNRFQWMSPAYGRHGHSQETYNQTQRGQPLLNTPKDKVSFSFKAAMAENRYSKNEPPLRTKNKDIQEHSKLAAEEAKAWELGHQWAFSCFFPFTDKSGCPEFIDISPEEFRYQAYKAKENNSYDSFVNAVNTAMSEVQTNRTHYKILSPEKLDIIERIYNGEEFTPLHSVNSIFGNSPSIEQIDMAELSTNNIGAATSKPSASSFRFVLPGDKMDKVPAKKDDDTHTPLDKLTSEEKEQYESSTFTVGKIPTKPPPYVLCF